MLATLLIVALTLAADAGSGMLRVEKSGDTYLIHDTANPFGNEYEGRLEGGKLIAEAGHVRLHTRGRLARA